MLETAEATTREPDHPPRDMKARVAGAGAVGFAAIVLLQNVIRGAAAPANDATSKEVLTYYTDHRAVTVVLMCTFVLSGIALAMFLGGAMRRLVAGGRPGWAYTGMVGAVGIMTLFGSGGRRRRGDVGRARTRQLNPAVPRRVVGVAQQHLHRPVPLHRCGAAGPLEGRRRAPASPLGSSSVSVPSGSALLALASMAGPFIAAGDAMPIFGLGGIGFLIWLAFLASTGVRLLTEERA